MSRSFFVSLVSLWLCVGVATGCGSGGGESSSNPPQNPTPALSTLNPTSANAGSAVLAFTTRVGQPWDFNGTGPGQLYIISGAFVKAAAVIGQPASPATLAPVHRTWGFERAPRPESGMEVHRKEPF